MCSDLIPAAGGTKITASFLTEMVDILIDYVKKQNDRSTKVHVYETLWNHDTKMYDTELDHRLLI